MCVGHGFRAVGQGLRVLVVQFIKGSWHYGEVDAAEMLGTDHFEIRAIGRGFVKIGGAEVDPEDLHLCKEAWKFGRAQSARYNLVIFDEIDYVISYRMLEAEKMQPLYPG